MVGVSGAFRASQPLRSVGSHGTSAHPRSQRLGLPLATCSSPPTWRGRLGVSRTWLYAAAKDGRIPAVRIGGPDGPLRFVPEDLERWLDHARAAWGPGQTSAATLRNLNEAA